MSTAKINYILLNENHGRYVARHGGAWDTVNQLDGELATVRAASPEEALDIFAAALGIEIRYRKSHSITDPQLNDFSVEPMEDAIAEAKALVAADEAEKEMNEAPPPAQLSRAMPELLAAALRSLGLMEQRGVGMAEGDLRAACRAAMGGSFEDVTIAARAAIAKATGGTK